MTIRDELKYEDFLQPYDDYSLEIELMVARGIVTWILSQNDLDRERYFALIANVRSETDSRGFNRFGELKEFKCDKIWWAMKAANWLVRHALDYGSNSQLWTRAINWVHIAHRECELDTLKNRKWGDLLRRLQERNHD